MNLSESLKDKNCADEVAILYRNSYGGHVVNFIASTVLAFAFIGDGMQQTKLIWWSAMTAFITYRLIDSCHWTFFLGGQVSAENAEKVKNKFFLQVTITATFWAAYPFLMFDSFGVLEFTCTAVIYAALAGGSVTVLAAHKLATMLYCTFLLLPMSILSLLGDDELIQVLGALGFVYLAVMLVTAAKSSKFTSEAIALKNQNGFLLEQVNHEKEVVKGSNTQLRQTLQQLHEAKESLEQKVSQRTRQIVKLNNRDSLTGLLNRKALLESIEKNINECIQKSTVFGLFFMDLDGFKQVNDTLGHEVGDQALARVADCLLDLDPEIVIGRWGGDEFVILKPFAHFENNTAPDSQSETQCNAMDFTKKLISHIQQLKIPGQNVCCLGASVGISYFPKDGIQPDELIRKADIAMFEHKNSDLKDAVEFRPEFLSRLEEKERLRNGLTHALEKQQMHLVYQPIVNTGTQKISRFEALLRWTFGDLNIPPYEFIAIAEQFGQIIQIGEWVLLEACCAASRWQRFSDSGVSVNVSAMQLLNQNFVASVKLALHESQLSPVKLNLEITESVICSDMTKAKAVLEEVKALGVTIAIDDFGTGYSSLSQIEQLPINCIKVDRYFVSSMQVNGTVILRATTMMAKEMSLNIVAEGVETLEQLNALQNIGVETFQGYFFAKPLPENEVEHYACDKLIGIMQKA